MSDATAASGARGDPDAIRTASTSPESVRSTPPPRSSSSAAAGNAPRRVSEGGEEWVLSIQSSVVHGYVGNKAAVFPLQLRGFDVDPVNSVQLSNHTGYSRFAGARMEGAALRTLVGGMEANGFLQKYSHVLSGYMGDESFLREAVRLVRAVKEATGGRATFLCDPVLGDGGRLYVPRAFIALYRDELVPMADTVTPNQTEAELLTGVRVATAGDAFRACCALHELGPRNVVVTSLELRESEGLGVIDVIATEAREGGLLPDHYLHLRVPRVEGYLSGTGDLVSSLLVAGLARGGGGAGGGIGLAGALEEAMAAVHFVIKKTHEMGRRELALVQSRAVLERPVVALRASVCPPPEHTAACRVTRHERRGRCLVAARPVRAGERVLYEGALVSVVPGGRRGPCALACAECAGSVGTLADQLRHLTADPSTVPDPLPAIDEEAARFSPGVFLCEAGCGEVYCGDVCRSRALETHHAALCPALGGDACTRFLRHAQRHQPLLVAAARVVASRALGRPLLPDDLGELVRAPYWEVAADAFDVEAAAERGEDGVTMATLRSLAEQEVRESWRLLVPCLERVCGMLPAWATVEQYALVAGALRLNNVAVDYASPLASYFALLDRLDGEAAGEASRALLPAVRSVMERLARGGEQAEEECEAKGGKGNEDEEDEEEQEQGSGSSSSEDEDELEVESVDLCWDGVRFSTAIFPPVSGSALFPVLACTNHSCDANAEVEFEDGSGRASLVTVRDVDEGEEFVISYVFEGLDSASDRARALAPYGFECACTRCGKTADE